jgi:CheY-like chemotaxis protein
MECKNILIVEDDQSIRNMMKDVLEIEGYKVHLAIDGSDGIVKLKTLLPQPCVILLDLMMPGANGWKFLDAQRSDPGLSTIPVVVCSAYKESAKSVHAQAIVNKPIQLDALINAVNSFCA